MTTFPIAVVRIPLTPIAYDIAPGAASCTNKKFIYSIPEALFLIHMKQEFGELLTQRNPLYFYSECTQKQQETFIKSIDATRISKERLDSEEFRVTTIVTNLHKKIRIQTNNYLLNFCGQEALANELSLQEVAGEMMKNLCSKGCNVQIFTLEQLNFLRTQ